MGRTVAAGMQREAPGQLALLGEQVAEAASNQASWNFRRSARARRLCARVHRDGRVDIIVPQRASVALVAEFVGRHRAWIESKVEQARRLAPAPTPFPPERIELPALGQSLRVHLAGGRQAPRLRLLPGDILAIHGDTSSHGALTRALQRWLLAHAKRELAAHLGAAAAQHGFRYSSMSIRRQRTRWGSCSTRGAISLNVCLLFQRPEVLRYLLVHELSHTVHMNHSARFWATVAACCPDWQALDRELLQGWRQVPQWVFRRA